MVKTVLLIGVLLLASAAAFSDTLYKWTDSQGVQRFSDKPPPPGVEAFETIETAPGPPPDDEQRPEFKQMMQKVEQENRRSEEEARQKALERAEAQRRKKEAERRSRIQAEKRRLEQKIEAIKKRGLGPNYSQGMRNAQIEIIQKQIDALEESSGPE